MVRGTLACLLLVVACAPVPAQQLSEPAAVEVPSPDQEIPTAPVEIDGVRLFDVRGVSAFPAERRAAAIAGRIHQVARDRSVAADGLAVESLELGSVIVAGSVRLMTVTDADAQLEGVGRPILAESVRLRIAQAIDAHRAARTPDALGGAVWRSAVATLLLLVLLWVVHRIGRRVDAALARRLERHARALSERSFELVRAERLWGAVHHAISVLRALAAVTVFALWARYVWRRWPGAPWPRSPTCSSSRSCSWSHDTCCA